MTTASPPSEIVLHRNGAWCWYQDERALIDPNAGLLVVGSIAAPEGEDGATRAGNVEITVLDLASLEPTVVTLHEGFEPDDHNAPALWRRSDGRWLAVHTRHKKDNLTWWRLSEPGDPTSWGPEHTFDWSEFTGGRGVTYSNLHELDGRLYCFARAINDDNCALVSEDEGETWSFAGKLFTREKVGYVNGYCRYANMNPEGRGTTARNSRVDVITTDHHPRDYNNSIYHGYLEGGKLYRSDGTVLDEHALQDEAPNQDGLTTVLEASSVWGGETITRAWTTDLRRDPQGRLAATMTARANDVPDDSNYDDHRFFYGRLEGDSWSVHELARAGAPLFPREQDYTGLTAIDPYDVDRVVISTYIDPRNGSTLAVHEIFEGRTTDAGRSWEWTPLTEGSTVPNLRPIVVPGDVRRLVVLWFRGEMTASQHYDCEVVAHIRAR